MENVTSDLLINLTGVRKAFRAPDRSERTVLEGVNFKLAEGEIVALLGKSGSGKSTLLRIIAGLIRANGGEVLYRGKTINGPANGISMVFQSFALFPWLTVQQNVELGLEAAAVPADEREKRALKVIDIIGLGGFESAYPRELSGGMRQRVGFARALVMEPDVLLMDEPFSALDVLTAETLRGDLLELWMERQIPTKGILFVSHNIEEAVSMSDRVLIFSSDPGRVKAEIPVNLPHPRDTESPAFKAIVDEIYAIMTQQPQRAAGSPAEPLSLGYRLPDATPHKIEGMLETLAEEFNGQADIPALAETLEVPDDSLFQLLEAGRLLGFTKVEHGDVGLLPAGHAYIEASDAGRKELFAEHLLHHISLATHIRRILDERRDHRAPEDRFLQELQDYLTDDEAERVLDLVINWGRYAEVFEYDYNSGVLSLPEEDEPPAAAEGDQAAAN
ncbi:MAG TPA: nitrate/sulfonate/bicarbonate ABC transporter ATP-binding protein [Candidatus Sulfotelmatobacter sp.]|jgi:NitT/TauT family transport system ATP-binding protein|nr:nitrate/sulfonate/bicarbonate ABC transporter ATP-binding protein [Candidatus Sulfotelmatobacter sp.]